MRVEVAPVSASEVNKPRTMALHNFVYDESSSSSSYRRKEQKKARDELELEEEPRFHPDLKRNVTVQLGGTAYLACQILNAGDYSVTK